MSWKPEIKTGTDPKFYSNALVFATKEEAEASARELMSRWFAVVGYRATESTDPVNYRFVNGQSVRIEPDLGEPFEGVFLAG